jgi:adenine-specific DNA-methyltransferase
VSRQPEWVRAFRDTWEKGIHSYLTYLRDRLTVARDLLTVRGSIFVQIGDDNVHLVRSLMDEVFGAANFVSQITFQTTSGFDTETISSVADFLLWYAKDKDSVKVRSLYQKKGTILGKGTATWLLLPDGTFRGVKVKEKRGEVPIPDGALLYKPGDLTGQGASTNPQPFTHEVRRMSLIRTPTGRPITQKAWKGWPLPDASMWLRTVSNIDASTKISHIGFGGISGRIRLREVSRMRRSS